MTVIIAVACLSISACGSRQESMTDDVNSEEVQGSYSMDASVDTADTELDAVESEDEGEPIENVASGDENVNEGEEKASEYWYIGIRFRDALGHEFYFLEPDEKGNPTKITLSGFSDENNGTFDFITEPNTMSPAETPDDPWIIGRIIGSGNLMIKDELGDDQFRMIGVEIWFAEE
ncbi:MAG: hypothetical protein IJ796_01675 [Lachnospiraceae bacterium]|nr:hypothetical protein [Lachnospiraceae bacterium]